MTQPRTVQSAAPERAPLEGLPRPTLPAPDVAEVGALLNVNDPQSVERATARLQQAARRAGLDDRQILTFRAIATDPRYGTADQSFAAARLYLQLLGAGCYAFIAEAAPNGASVPREQAQQSRQLMDGLLQSAATVWRGTNVKRPTFDGMSREQRLGAFVEQFHRNINARQPFRAAMDAARNHMLTPQGQRAFADAAAGAPAPRATAQAVQGLTFPSATVVRTAGDIASVRHNGRSPRAFTMGPPVAARPLTRSGPRPASGADPYAPMAPAAAAQHRDRPPERIKGTDIAWTPDAVAQYIEQNTNDERRIDVLHGLRLPDRVAVAEAYARRRGQSLQGQQALAFLSEQMAGRGTGTNAQIFRDLLRPENTSGITSEHILIYSDATGGGFLSRLTGIGGPNHQAIERILMFRSPAELQRLDAQMRETYGKSLREVLQLVNVREGRERLLFIHDLPGREQGLGEVPQAELQAWNMRVALDEFERGFLGNAANAIQAFSSVQWHDVFRPLAMMSNAEVRQVAAAYHRQQVAAGRQVEGGDGLTGNVADSAYGRAVLAAQAHVTRLAPSRQAHDLRTRIALQGLRFDPQQHMPPRQAGETENDYRERVTAAINAAEVPHRTLVAQYVAATLSAASHGHLTTADTQFALSLIRRTPPPGQPFDANGRPFVGEVSAFWQQMGGVQQIQPSEEAQLIAMVRAANRSVRGTREQENTWNLMAGDGADSPMSRSVQLMAALQGSMGMFSGPYRQRTYAFLDMRNVPEGQRNDFMAQMRAAYYQLSGGRMLNADVQQAFGPSITLPNGAVIPSQAARLVERGVLSNAERVIYSLYEPGLFGVVRADNIQAVSQILSELSPLEKFIAREEFTRLTGTDLRAVVDAYPGREARMASLALRIHPHERDLLGAQAMIYLNAPTTDAALEARRAQLLGVNQEVLTDFWSRNFYDQAGLDAMRATVNARGGAAQFSIGAVDSTADLHASIDAATRAALGNGLTRGIQDFLSNSREGIQIRRRALEELTARAQRDIEATGAVSPDTQREMGLLVRDLRQRFIDRGRDVDQATELVANIAVTAALVGAMALQPQIGAIWMSVIGGGTGLATRMALGQVDTATQALGIFIRDAAKGLATQQTALMMSYMPADAPLLWHAAAGASAGYNHGAITSVANFITDPMLWRIDPSQALSDFEYNFANATNSGMAWGAASGLIFGYIRREAQRNSRPPDRPTEPNPDPGTQPGRPTDPDRPVTGGPDRPVTPGPDRPVTPGTPTRPSRPDGNISTPGGPTPGRPSGRPDSQLGTPGGPTPGRPSGRPDSQLGTPTGPTPGRPGVGPIVHPGDNMRPPVTGGTGTARPPVDGGNVRPPVTPPRDVSVTPGAVPPSGRLPSTNTGIGGVTGGRVGMRSAAIPNTGYTGTFSTTDPGAALNIGIMHWGAVATAGVTNFGTTLSTTQRAAVDEMGRRIATTPIPLVEVRNALQSMSREENREVMRNAAAGFVFSAFAYLQATGGLPGPESEPTHFNTLLDLAWQDAGVANGRDPRSVSRAAKVRELVTHYYQQPDAPIQPQPAPRDSNQRDPSVPQVPGSEEPRAPAGPGRAPAQFYQQLAQATRPRLDRVSRAWIDANLQSALAFRTGEQVQRFPDGGVEYWTALLRRLPDKRLPDVIRDDAESLRAFGYNMPTDRNRQEAVSEGLVAARARALQVAHLGGTRDAPQPLTVPQLFERLPQLRDFMAAATGNTPAEMGKLDEPALASAIQGYKQRLAAQPRTAAIMQGAAQGPIIDHRTLEAHQSAAGVAGPDALPQAPAQRRQAFDQALEALRAAPDDQVAARSGEAVRILELIYSSNMPDQDRDRDVNAIAEAVLGQQPQSRATRVAGFLMGTQGSQVMAREVWNRIYAQLSNEEKAAIAMGIAGNIRAADAPAPAGTIPLDLNAISVDVLRSLDRLPLTQPPGYEEAARQLRLVSIARLLNAGEINKVVPDELRFALLHGSPQLLSMVAFAAQQVPGGQALLINQFVELANAGRADRVGRVLQSLAATQDARYQQYAVDLASALWRAEIIRRIDWRRQDDLAVATAYDQLAETPQAPPSEFSPLIAAMNRSENGRAAMRQMMSAVQFDATLESPGFIKRLRDSHEARIYDRFRAMLNRPMEIPGPPQQ
ncbi:MAG: hypothetical protein ACAI38_08990 [Myxococcota bacterium]